MLRRLLETLSRNRVVKRRLPASAGGQTLYVSPDASMRFWRSDLESADPLILAMAAELVAPGDTVWDIGANVGLFAFAAAFAAGPAGAVLAVEADEWLAHLLRRSALAATAKTSKLAPSHARVQVLSLAVADAPGLAELCIARRGRAGNHLLQVPGSTQTGGTREVRQVQVETLDGILERFAAPQMVKIDIEGAELLALRGAERLLSEHGPILLCEVASENADEVTALLHRHGYRLYDATEPLAARTELEQAVWNTLALPAARMGGCEERAQPERS